MKIGQSVNGDKLMRSLNSLSDKIDKKLGPDAKLLSDNIVESFMAEGLIDDSSVQTYADYRVDQIPSYLSEVERGIGMNKERFIEEARISIIRESFKKLNDEVKNKFEVGDVFLGELQSNLIFMFMVQKGKGRGWTS